MTERTPEARTPESKPIKATGLDDQQNANAGGLPTLSDPASAWRIDSGGNSPPRAIMDAASRSPVENRDSGAVASSAEGHPEDACERCGRLNVVWFTRNELWNRIPPTHDILCPCCFVQLAEESGLVPTGWLLIPEDLDLLSVVDAQAERIKNLVNDQRAYALCVGADPDKVPEAEVLETACRLWAEMKVNADLVAAQAERIRDLEQDAVRLRARITRPVLEKESDV